MMVQIEVMKNEVITYQTPADSIKPLVERKDDKGQDTFDISDWWKANCAKLPEFTYVFGAVLINSHNSCPPKRLCTIFNSTFDADPIRSRLTLTTYSYRYSLSLTIEHSSSRVSRTEGEREEWVRGFIRLRASAIIHCHVHAGTLVVSGICQTKNRAVL